MLGALAFALGLITSGVLLFIQVFYLIMLSDLESDFINPIELCQKLNVFVLPEYAAHAVISALFLLQFEILITLFNGGLVAYHYFLYKEDRYWFDPTEIFRDLGRRKKEAMTKLAFYMLSFFYYLYRMILALII